MKQVALSVVEGGIQRLRVKGGAKNTSLYDALNCYVTAAKTIKPRPGTVRDATLPSNTKGLVSFDGALHTFATEITVVPDGYVCHVIANPDDTEQALTKIHFAAPYLGFLYVVAEFADASVWHFWLQSSDWAANSVYNIGDAVEPSTPNGLAYKATRLEAARPLWTANSARVVGDAVEPTEYNGYYYTVVDVTGDNPRSGTTEPAWPTSEGEQIIEDINETATTDAETGTDDDTTLPADVEDRYG